MKYWKNPDEEIRNLERQIQSGISEVIEPYLRQLSRVGQMENDGTSQQFQNDLETAQHLFSLNPELVINYCQLTMNNRLLVQQILALRRRFAYLKEMNELEALMAHFIENPDEEIRADQHKFRSILDSLIYQLYSNEFVSNETWGNNAHLYRFEEGDLQVVNRMSVEQTGNFLTADEIRLILDSVGAILAEDSQGLVSVEFYDDLSQLRNAWSEIVAHYTPEEETLDIDTTQELLDWFEEEEREEEA